VRIRRDSADDLDLLCRMRLAFLADHRGVDVESLGEDLAAATRAVIAAGQAAGTMLSWLAEDDDRAVGLVSLLLLQMPPRPVDVRTAEGYVINMYVEPAARRGGVGRALLGACVTAARARGLRRLLLHATDDGRPLYEGVGFAPNDAWMEMPLPEEG
jgi:GNAT superfamily N-acetyltransferase